MRAFKVVSCFPALVTPYLPSFPPKLKEDYEEIRQNHTKLTIKMKTIEIELEVQVRRCDQLEDEIKAKVLSVFNFSYM